MKNIFKYYNYFRIELYIIKIPKIYDFLLLLFSYFLCENVVMIHYFAVLIYQLYKFSALYGQQNPQNIFYSGFYFLKKAFSFTIFGENIRILLIYSDQNRLIIFRKCSCQRENLARGKYSPSCFGMFQLDWSPRSWIWFRFLSEVLIFELG